MNSVKKIHLFWKEKARLFKTKQDASWSDILVTREIRELSKYIVDGFRVLDVGCASGFSSLQYASRKNIKLLGVDYVKEMVAFAKDAQSKVPSEVARRVEFKVGDAMDIKVPKESFDLVMSTRCLCNLTSWANQKKAILSMLKALKPGGILLLSEPTIQGLEELNKLGQKFGLEALTAPWHNLYLDESELLKLSPKYFSLTIDNFSSSYYLFSRILYRWYVRGDVTKLKRGSLFNTIGILLPSYGNWGVQRLYILKKPNRSS